MADTYIQYSNPQLKQCRDDLYRARATLRSLVASTAQMKDGGVVGALIESHFGCPNNAEAVALVGELESLDFKLNTNDSQSNLNAAIDQFLARFGP